MIEVGLFAEDDGHRALLVPLIERVAAAEAASVLVHVRNAEGGTGRVLTALRGYGQDLAGGTDSFLDVLVVALDGNCHGAPARQRAAETAVGTAYPGQLVVAVPDPHVEVWYLSDPTALPQVLGEDFSAEVPPYKCERHRYKKALRQACRQAGVEPVAGGVEYGQEVAAAMDLELGCRREEGLGRFRDDLRGAIRSAAPGGGR